MNTLVGRLAIGLGIMAVICAIAVYTTRTHVARRLQEALWADYVSQIEAIHDGRQEHLVLYSSAYLEALLSRKEILPRIRSISITADLSGNDWHALKQLPSLQSLSLYDSSNADNLFAGLVGMEAVERLHIKGAGLSDQGLAYIAKLPKLERLTILGEPVSDTGIGYLADHASLQFLELSNTHITNEGVALLKRLPNMRQLILEDDRKTGSRLDGGALRHLKELRGLSRLELRGGWASHADVEELRTALPSVDMRVESGEP
jgi:hypothetical protein